VASAGQYGKTETAGPASKSVATGEGFLRGIGLFFPQQAKRLWDNADDLFRVNGSAALASKSTCILTPS